MKRGWGTWVRGKRGGGDKEGRVGGYDGRGLEMGTRGGREKEDEGGRGTRVRETGKTSFDRLN